MTLIRTKIISPDEVVVTVIDFKPTPEEIKQDIVQEPLRKGIVARDTCGDGTEEYLLNKPPAIWRTIPVKYYVEPTIPSALISGIDQSFNEFNIQAGFKLYERTYSDIPSAKIKVLLGPIDTKGATLAQAEWSYSPSTLTMNKATITFDSNENWSLLAQESCGAIGNIFDIANVGTHEVGHVSGLAHAPTDKLQTMYATTSPGKTLGRSLGNGDRKGFRKAYNITDNPPEPTPEPDPTPTPEPEPTPEPTPTPPPEPIPVPAGHKLTKEQQTRLKTAQTAYEIAKKTGDANIIGITKEQLDDISCQILTELHS